MSDENLLQISLLLGMLHALAGYFQHQFNDDQQRMFNGITADIDRIYYPQKPNPLEGAI
jgi:hypothetical protein